MKKVLSGIAILAALCFAGSLVRAQDAASGEKTYKAKCAGCHGQEAEGKPRNEGASDQGQECGRNPEANLDFAQACLREEPDPG